MKPTAKGCNEYEVISRRGLMGQAGARALQGIVPAWLPTVTYQQDAKAAGGGHRRQFGERDIIVSVYLRGGCDGLTACVPYGDEAYYGHRSSLAVPRPDQTTDPNRAIDLDGFFGVPQSMQPMKELYDAGHFLFVHGAGSKDSTRSHFDAQQFMEAGKADKGLWTGWLGRHLASTADMVDGSLLRAIGLSGLLALTLEGGPKTTALSNLTDLRYGGRGESEKKRIEWLQKAYATGPEILRDAASNAFKTVDLLKSINYENYVPGGGAVYNQAQPGGGGLYGSPQAFGDSMRASAAIIRKDVGVEAIHVDYGDWDTHEGQNNFGDYGHMFMQLYSLSANLRAFFKDVDSSNLMGRVTVVIVSEFGRTVQQNGSAGTDHGHGNVMMLMGKNVNGGRVMADWPGLANDLLFEGNALKTTIDYRDILAEVVQKRLKNDNLEYVFPDPSFTPVMRNAVRA